MLDYVNNGLVLVVWLYMILWIELKTLLREFLNVRHDDLNRGSARGFHRLAASAIHPGEDFREWKRIKTEHLKRLRWVVIVRTSSENLCDVLEERFQTHGTKLFVRIVTFQGVARDRAVFRNRDFVQEIEQPNTKSRFWLKKNSRS